MPTVLCPYCTRATTLPDPWTHAGYTCPHCHSTVALAVPATPATPPAPDNPFDLSDAPSRPRVRHYRDRTTASDSFAQGFGHALGQHAAGCVAACVGVAALAVFAAYFLYLR